MLLLFLGVIVLSASSSSDAFGLTCAGKFGQLLPASTLDVLVASWRNLARATQPLPGKDGQFYYLISFCAVGPDDGSNTATFSKMGSDQMTIELHAPPSAFVCSYIASGACGFTAMRLPSAPAGYYIAQYASILSWVQVNTLIWTTDSLTRYGVPSYTIDAAIAVAPQTYLRACTNALPFNSIYGPGTTTPGVCIVIPCALGLRATAPARTSGFLAWSAAQNDASLLPSCAACPAPPANAFFKSNGADPCGWYCNASYYYSDGGCKPCVTMPGNAPPPNAVFVAADPTKQGTCPWQCAPGSYYNGTWCRECPAGTFSGQGGSAVITACLPCPASPSCGVGQYRTMDTATCTVPGPCQPCTNAVPLLEAYRLDPITGLSADPMRPNACYTTPCVLSRTAGLMANPNCSALGATDPSNTMRPCDTTGVAALGAYFVLDADGFSRCSIAPCAACTTVPGFYNPYCPGSMTAAEAMVYAGSCDAPCAALPSGAVWDFPWSRVIADPTDCPFRCTNSTFFYPSNGACVPKPDSLTCGGTGQYMTEGGACVACPANYGAPGGGLWTWSASGAGFGAQACRWACVQGWYWSLATNSCTVCTADALGPCSIGYYPSVPCLLNLAAREDPSCQPCASSIVAPHSFMAGAGALNAPLSCPLQCNAGYFMVTSPQGCAPWTPMPSSYGCNAGYYWGGGTPQADNACQLCPNYPAMTPSYYAYLLVWPAYGIAPVTSMTAVCNWTCAAGAYFDGSARTCTPCPAGSATATNGMPAVCLPCPAGTYQALIGSTSCAPCPGNASSWVAGSTACVCNAAFKPGGLLMLGGGGGSCVPCVPSLPSAALVLSALHMTNASGETLFVPGQCTLAAFGCALGFFRAASMSNAVGIGGGACAPCPWLMQGQYAAVANSDNAGARARALCGAYPACLLDYDEQQLACTPDGNVLKCAPGFYLTQYAAAGAHSVLPAYHDCYECANEGCLSLGMYNAPCTGSDTLNRCTSCSSTSHNPGEVWGFLTCQLTCDVGYFLVSSTCALCRAGTYQAAQSTASACTLCAAGTYAAGNGSSACSACSTGTFASAAGATACAVCAAGTYGTPCVPCPAQTYNPGGTALTACLQCPATAPVSLQMTACQKPAPVCPAGWWLAAPGDAFCTACLPGTFCTGAANPPQPCPAGRAPSPPLATSLTQCVGNAPGALLRVQGFAPIPCPTMTTTYGLSGATSVAWCYARPGFYGFPNGSAAAPCPFDAYCPAASLFPVPCPAPTAPYASAMSADVSACSGLMRPPCRPGYYLPFASYLTTSGTVVLPAVSPTCLPCPPGCYCPGGLYTALASTNLTAFLPPSSSAQWLSLSASWCGSGTYAADAAYSVLQGALNNNNNVALWWMLETLVAGAVASNIAACSASSADAWRTPANAVRAAQCAPSVLSSTVSCPAFTQTYVAGVPITSTAQCRANAGYYYVPGAAAAVQCPSGYYCPPGALQPQPCSLALTCTTLGSYTNPTPCPAGVSAPPATVCLPCAAGTISALAAANAFYPTAGSCQICCVAGFVRSGSVCLAQPSTFAFCTAIATFRALAPACSVTLPSCTACPPSPIPGLSVALMPAFVAANIPTAAPYGNGGCGYGCAAGACMLGGATKPYYALPEVPAGASCVLSPVGYIPVGGVCAQCPAGTYQPTVGGTACLACPTSGWAPAAGSSECLCAPGSVWHAGACAPCPVGTVWTASNRYTCQRCPPGTTCYPYRHTPGPCPAGSFRATPDASCAPCPSGTISAVAEATACTSCPPGQFVATPGAPTACAVCSNGKYGPPGSLLGSAAECSPCPSQGQVSSADGTACLCNTGQFLNLGACVPCAARCAATNARVLGCTAPGATALSFTCACNAGYQGDGYVACLPCPASSAQCGCGPGTYYTPQGCAPCRICPSIATTLTPCLYGSTADTTACVCPDLYYYSARLNQCMPCAICAQGAVALSTCAAGVRSDTTQCACLPPASSNATTTTVSSGDGFTC